MKKIFVLLISLISFLPVFGQTGTIRGTVYDDADGEPMIGATVVIAGTTQGGSCDLDGRFTINNVEPGTYDLQVSFVSYEPQTISGVEVKAGEITLLNNIRMKEGADVLEEVVVQAEALRDSENALLTVQKKSPVLLDAISAEQFSRNGDNNVASAIKRVTGVTVEGGKYVYVRGLGDRYSKTVLNGAEIPGLDPDRNSVQLDIFPSNLVNNIIVYKTFSPELSADFSGGYVNIETKDFPDELTVQLSTSIGYNTQASMNNDFLTNEGSPTDILGFDNGFRALPVMFDGVTPDSDPSFPTAFVDNQRLDAFSNAFETNQMDVQQKTSFLDHRINFSVGNQVSLFGKPFGFVAAINYNRSFESYQDGQFIRYERPSEGVNILNPQLNLNDNRSEETVLLGGMLSGSVKLNDNNKIKINLVRNQMGTNSARDMMGTWLDQFSNYETRTLYYNERVLNTGQLAGEHLLAGLNNLKIDWISSYTLSTQEEPDIRFFTTVFRDNPTDASDYIISNRTRRPSRYWRNMEESNFDNRLNFNLPFTFSGREAKLKFGGTYTQKSRDFNEDRYEYNYLRVPYEGNPDAYFSPNNLGYLTDAPGGPTSRLGMTVEYATQPSNIYSADQTVTAAYLGTELPITEKLKFNGGARVETTQLSIESESGASGELGLTDVLPAANFTYELIEDMNLRASYSKTLARPTFREFAPLSTFGFAGDFIQSGNPQLERTLIDNFDFRWEYYPRPGEYLSVSPFYKHFTNPIENTILTGVGENDLQLQWQNREEATLYGIEFEIRKSLDFISQGLSNFRFTTNLTLVHSEVALDEGELAIKRQWDANAEATRPLFNQSPYVLNVGLQYLDYDRGTEVNLTYNVFGERLAFVGLALPDVFEQPRPELNFNFRQEIGSRWRATFRARNLLNPDYLLEQELAGTEYVFTQYTRGIDFSLGFSYSIN